MLSLASRRSQLNHFATPLAAPNHEWGLYKIKKAPPRGRGQGIGDLFMRNTGLVTVYQKYFTPPPTSTTIAHPA